SRHSLGRHSLQSSFLTVYFPCSQHSLSSAFLDSLQSAFPAVRILQSTFPVAQCSVLRFREPLVRGLQHRKHQQEEDCCRNLGSKPWCDCLKNLFTLVLSLCSLK